MSAIFRSNKAVLSSCISIHLVDIDFVIILGYMNYYDLDDVPGQDDRRYHNVHLSVTRRAS